MKKGRSEKNGQKNGQILIKKGQINEKKKLWRNKRWRSEKWEMNELMK